jgi:hypothetical protein
MYSENINHMFKMIYRTGRSQPVRRRVQHTKQQYLLKPVHLQETNNPLMLT